MGIVIVVLAFFAVAGAWLWWTGREPAPESGGATRARSPGRADSPGTARADAPKPDPMRRPQAKHRYYLWRLRANATPCDIGRGLAGRLAETETQAPPPLPPCGQVNCCCHYELLPDQRKGARRTAIDRRDGLRFEEKTDRRKRRDRRKGASDLWKGPNER